MKSVLLTLMLFLGLGFDLAAQTTYAERLGWPKGARVLMIHADDAGMSHASNQGIIATVEAGTVTSFSIMMPCAWVPEIAAYLKEHPEVCAGVHLTFTAEWDHYRWAPVAGRNAVPGLVDANGFMHDGVRQVTESATAAEIEQELRAQIALAEKMGIDVSHMDSHMGTLFAHPEYLSAYVKIGIEKQIPLLVVGSPDSHLEQEVPDAAARLRAIAGKVWAAGLPVLDHVNTDSYDWNTLDKSPHFIDLVRNLEPGITWANVHPTTPTEEGKAITNNREKLFGDYLGLIDPEIMKVIAEEGVILTTWRELKERRTKVVE